MKPQTQLLQSYELINELQGKVNQHMKSLQMNQDFIELGIIQKELDRQKKAAADIFIDTERERIKSLKKEETIDFYSADYIRVNIPVASSKVDNKKLKEKYPSVYQDVLKKSDRAARVNIVKER